MCFFCHETLFLQEMIDTEHLLRCQAIANAVCHHDGILPLCDDCNDAARIAQEGRQMQQEMVRRLRANMAKRQAALRGD